MNTDVKLIYIAGALLKCYADWKFATKTEDGKNKS